MFLGQEQQGGYLSGGRGRRRRPFLMAARVKEEPGAGGGPSRRRREATLPTSSCPLTSASLSSFLRCRTPASASERSQQVRNALFSGRLGNFRK